MNIDPKRGTHFDGKKIVVTDHAAERAVKRFGRKHNEARRWIADNLRKSAYIGETITEEGAVRSLYAHERVAYVVSKADGAVITVYPQHSVTPSLRSKVEEIVARELRRARRKFERVSRSVEIEKADLGVKRAEYYRKLVRTTSDRVRSKMEAEVKAIDDYCAKLDEELTKVRQEKSTLVKGAVAYL